MGKKSARKSASKWDEVSERTLLEIWSEKMDELRGCRKNSHILLEMVAQLQDNGYTYTVVELRTKMHNLSSRYRKEKQKIATSPSEWHLYKDMEALLAPFESYHCDVLDCDSINNMESEIITSEPLPQVSFSPLSSPSTTASSPLPSASMASSSPLPSPSDSSPAASLVATKKEEELTNFLKNIENNIEKISEDIKETAARLIAIEEEKKEILKAYVERESEVQKALVDFLKK